MCSSKVGSLYASSVFILRRPGEHLESCTHCMRLLSKIASDDVKLGVDGVGKQYARDHGVI